MTSANVSPNDAAASPPTPSIQKWFPVTTVEAHWVSGCTTASTRATRFSGNASHTPIASSTAQPTCSDGIAAYGLTKNDVDCAWYERLLNACRVSIRPVSGTSRGGATGNNEYATRAHAPENRMAS